MVKLYEYFIRRVISMIPLLIFITLFVFTLIHIAPGDPMIYMFAEEMGEEYQHELREIYIKKWGLDKPIWQQYFIWLSNVVRGDLGYSYMTGRPVAELVFGRIPRTLELALSSLFLALIIAIPLGVLSAVNQNSVLDRFVTSFSVVANSLPSFWVGIIMIVIFSVNLGWVPTSGAGLGKGLVPHLKSLILPTLVLGLSRMGMITRLLRSSLLEVLSEDYIVTARAKGLKEYIVIYKHALRNALLPVVTLLGLSLAFLISGSVMIETVFSWPGMGKFFVLQANRRDYTTIMGVNLTVSVAILVAMLITDLTFALLDPRIKY
jgi:peptide/nickel transport system permease protein